MRALSGVMTVAMLMTLPAVAAAQSIALQPDVSRALPPLSFGPSAPRSKIAPAIPLSGQGRWQIIPMTPGLVAKPTTPAPASAMAPPQTSPLDCKMVVKADPTVDHKMTIAHPPPAVDFKITLNTAAPCASK